MPQELKNSEVKEKSDTESYRPCNGYTPKKFPEARQSYANNNRNTY